MESGLRKRESSVLERGPRHREPESLSRGREGPGMGTSLGSERRWQCHQALYPVLFRGRMFSKALVL